MRQLAMFTFVIATLGPGADADAQAKDKGVKYIDVSEAQCRSVCQARGWSQSDCVPYCRPGSCRQATTGGERFCVVRKKK